MYYFVDNDIHVKIVHEKRNLHSNIKTEEMIQ